MPYKTTVHKVAELAVKAEEAGEGYYRHLAQVVSDKKVKELCGFFAAQEVEHREQFQKIADEAKHDDAEKTFSLDVVTMMHDGINNLKRGYQSGEKAGAGLDLKGCLELALNAEEETIKLYQDIQSALEGRYNSVLFKIIHEEHNHADTIRSVMYKTVKKPQPRATYSETVLEEDKYRPSVKLADPKKGQKVIIHQGETRDSFKDYVYIVLLIILFLGLVLAMVGPQSISGAVKLILGR